MLINVFIRWYFFMWIYGTNISLQNMPFVLVSLCDLFPYSVCCQSGRELVGDANLASGTQYTHSNWKFEGNMISLMASVILIGWKGSWAPSQYKDGLYRYGIFIIKMRWLWDHLIFVMGFPVLVSWYLFIQKGPCDFILGCMILFERSWGLFRYKGHLFKTRIPFIDKIRWSWNLFFIMGMSIQVWCHLSILYWCGAISILKHPKGRPYLRDSYYKVKIDLQLFHNYKGNPCTWKDGLYIETWHRLCRESFWNPS